MGRFKAINSLSVYFSLEFPFVWIFVWLKSSVLTFSVDISSKKILVDHWSSGYKRRLIIKRL